MKYRINYYADRKIMFKRIHIMDPRLTGTYVQEDKKTAEKEAAPEQINESKFIVPWQLT